MKRRQFLAATAAALAAIRERAEAAQATRERNTRWCVSIGIWNDLPPAPLTEKLDAIRDAGFHGFRMTGFPGFLQQHDLTIPTLEKKLSKRDLRIATLSFGGPADDPSKHAEIEQRAREDLRLASGELVKKEDHGATFRLTNYDLGDGEIDFPALHRILKRRRYKGWICVDHHHLRISPRYNFGRCMQNIKEKLEPIYL